MEESLRDWKKEGKCPVCNRNFQRKEWTVKTWHYFKTEWQRIFLN